MKEEVNDNKQSDDGQEEKKAPEPDQSQRPDRQLSPEENRNPFLMQQQQQVNNYSSDIFRCSLIDYILSTSTTTLPATTIVTTTSAATDTAATTTANCPVRTSSRHQARMSFSIVVSCRSRWIGAVGSRELAKQSNSRKAATSVKTEMPVNGYGSPQNATDENESRRTVGFSSRRTTSIMEAVARKRAEPRRRVAVQRLASDEAPPLHVIEIAIAVAAAAKKVGPGKGVELLLPLLRRRPGPTPSRVNKPPVAVLKKSGESLLQVYTNTHTRR